MKEFREARPEWKFLSECDKAAHAKEDGFVLLESTEWTEEQLDSHYNKFFVELFSMAFAKYWIGVKYTNVSWFILFMRRANLDTTDALYTPGRAEGITLELWR